MNKQKFKIDWSKAMDKIREQGDGKKGGNSFKDERVYYPQFNENGTAQAIIRFLPSPDTDIPYVSVYTHSIKGPGGWYIENCPTTLKKECPVCKANSAIWDSDPDTARSRKRKQNYFSNILVVKDPLNPENENKVFLYKYGKKVHDRIMEKLQPGQDSIEEPVMVFDYYEGADFKLIIKKVKVGNISMPNYDNCQFDTPSSVGTDEEIEKVNKSLYGLSEFIAEGAFKGYDELESKFDRVMGSRESRGFSQNTPSTTPSQASSKPAQTKQEPITKTADATVFAGNDDEFFNDLQNEEDEEKGEEDK
jgi:hypothetical protein